MVCASSDLVEGLRLEIATAFIVVKQQEVQIHSSRLFGLTSKLKRVMGVNTDNVVEHLKVLFKQELSGDYQVKDYLGLAASNLSVFDEIGDDGSMISDSEDFNNSSSCMRHSSFRLTPEGRRQIGQWFYRSKLSSLSYLTRITILALN